VAGKAPAGTPAGRHRPRGRSLLLGAVAVVVLLAAGVLWYLNRSTPAPVTTETALEAARDAAEEAEGQEPDASAAPATDPDGADDEVEDADPDGGAGSRGGLDPSGTWRVDRDQVPFGFDAGSGTFVGFRVDEELATVGATTAVGRTPAVDGELTIDGTALTAATVTADLSVLRTDIAQRDSRVQQALDTSTHPTATFTLTEVVELNEVPPLGESRAAQAVGELTLRGVTRPVTVPVEAVRLTGDTLLVTGSVEVVLDDFGITVPSAPIVVSVADTGTMELQLHLRRR
jgi:polyisoprenoid-binding protein YceI